MENQKESITPENGSIYYSSGRKEINSLPWTEHPKFKGVYLKHIIKGKESCGAFSSHFVKVNPEACIELHTHDNQMELHEVIQGDGLCILKGIKIKYSPGKMTIIHKGEEHMVKAGGKGLIILAKFFPALV